MIEIKNLEHSHSWYPNFSELLFNCLECGEHISWREVVRYRELGDLFYGPFDKTKINWVLNTISSFKEKDRQERIEIVSSS